MRIPTIDSYLEIDTNELAKVEDVDIYCIELFASLYKEHKSNYEFIKEVLTEFVKVQKSVRN